MATAPFGMWGQVATILGANGVKDPWFQGGRDCTYPSVALSALSPPLLEQGGGCLQLSPASPWLAAPTPVPHRCAPTPAPAVALGVSAVPLPASFPVPFPISVSIPPVPLPFPLSLPVPLSAVLSTLLPLQLSVPLPLRFLLTLFLLFFFLLLSPLLPLLGPFSPLCLLLNNLAVSQRKPVDAGSCLGLTEKVIQKFGGWFLLSFL